MRDYRIVIYIANLPDDIDPEKWVDDLMTAAIDARGDGRVVVSIADIEYVNAVEDEVD